MEPKKRVFEAMPTSVAAVTDRMVRAEMMDAHVKRPEAERIVARRAGVTPSTLQNLKRGRLKNDYVEAIGSRIRAAFVATLERQLAALERDLANARLQLASARKADVEVDLAAAEAAIEAAKVALGRRRG